MICFFHCFIALGTTVVIVPLRPPLPRLSLPAAVDRPGSSRPTLLNPKAEDRDMSTYIRKPFPLVLYVHLVPPSSLGPGQPAPPLALLHPPRSPSSRPSNPLPPPCSYLPGSFEAHPPQPKKPLQADGSKRKPKTIPIDSHLPLLKAGRGSDGFLLFSPLLPLFRFLLKRTGGSCLNVGRRVCLRTYSCALMWVMNDML